MSDDIRPAPDKERLRGLLLAWYDAHARALPWRLGPAARKRGERPDPYRVWLSEIMLQQTTVVAVRPYYERFLSRFPDVFALARADQDEVLTLWAGLGYYARARNLHACAKAVAAAGGAFPDTEAGLRALPGVGVYTAAAIAAICFDEPTNVVDGNVERVMARLRAVETPLPGGKPALRDCAAALTGLDRPGDYAQALMDLGATVCTRTSPACEVCPWREACAAYAADAAADYPRRAAKKPKPERRGVAFVLVRGGRVFLRRRPEKGLLGGMAEPPTTPWRDTAWSRAEALAHAPVAEGWRVADDVVRHTFTHFHLELTIWRTDAAERRPDDDGWWASAHRLEEEALPTVMRKAVEAGLAA